MTGTAGQLAAALRRARQPPIDSVAFWVVQALVIGLAGLHFALDLASSSETHAIPAGIPVAMLLVPVSYAAARFGLSGSVATAAWASLLWLPDLLLPHDQGHVVNDIMELFLVDAVAVFVGYHIDSERHERAKVALAEAEHRRAETRYRQLFDTNAAPILVLDGHGVIREANPAAGALAGGSVVGRDIAEVLGCTLEVLARIGGGVVTSPAAAAERRDFRPSLARVPAEAPAPDLTQVVLEDVTEERAEGLRARHYAGLLLDAIEEERRRVARELHDEPLQLLVHLARHLELLATLPDVPADAVEGLAAARHQVLDVAVRLRSILGDLRPPALEQLGLVAALRGLLADTENDTGIRTELKVLGAEAGLTRDVALGAFRIVQEAVNNVVRHAGAHWLSVAVEFDDGGGVGGDVLIEVRDDGRGFDSRTIDERPRSDRLGTLGMRERTKLLGGTIEIASTPGQGTTVRARIPLTR